ncbi:hypothetical protein N7456_013162 [Penicillium angulare]|uniref:Uncharacterized protein n=1 Tax=Penicillium angulare TaxID=116970 RepID=A0A9W9EL66_9EURO|nr:hypothetical protein N7456_013162 [Penicillium angulare]
MNTALLGPFEYLNEEIFADRNIIKTILVPFSLSEALEYAGPEWPQRLLEEVCPAIEVWYPLVADSEN